MEIEVEPGFHELGDPDSIPGGNIWEGSFRIPSRLLDTAVTAHLELSFQNAATIPSQ